MSALFDALCRDLPKWSQPDPQGERFITLDELTIDPDHPAYSIIQGLVQRGYLRTQGQPPQFDVAQLSEFLLRLMFVQLPQDHPFAQFVILMDRVSPELAAAKNEVIHLRRALIR